MDNRQHAFGHQSYNVLDNLIYSLRRRQVERYYQNRTGTVVDLGAGYDCRLLRSFLQNSPTLSGIAVDSEFDESLPSERLTLLTADLNGPLPIPTASVDTVLSLAVLEHLLEPALFLNEIYRILRPGGMLLLTTPGPSAQPLLEFLAYRLKVIDEHEIRDHKHYFSSAELIADLTNAGFSKERVQAKTFIFGMNNVVIATRE